MTDFEMSPTPVVTVSDVERIAHSKLPRNALDYYRSGADQMTSLKDNRNAFQRYVFYFVGRKVKCSCV